MKQSSIDWLIDQLEKHYVKTDLKNTVAYQQAKAMHRDEIVDLIVQYEIKHHDIFSELAILNVIGKAEEHYSKTF